LQESPSFPPQAQVWRYFGPIEAGESLFKTLTMKHVLSTLGISATLALVMTACGNRQDKVAAEAARQLQEYKDSIRLAADTAGLAEYQQWKAQNELVNEPEPAAPVAAPTRSTAARSSSVKRSASSSNGGGSYSSTSSQTAKSKEGWSKAAKGAVIGGAGGAVAGAVINKKNRTVGAIVGGVVGGAVGYGVGRSKDKKDGRY
jgi:hypothetical protein